MKALEQGFLQIIWRIVEDKNLTELVLGLAQEGNLCVCIERDALELIDGNTGEVVTGADLRGI